MTKTLLIILIVLNTVDIIIHISEIYSSAKQLKDDTDIND